MGSYVTANQIKTWEQYFRENERTIPSTATPLYPVDNEINRKVSLWEGDITRLRVDAIVNAAKKSLAGGGGVDGAIHRAAGPGLKAESVRLGPIRPGTAVITGGHNLPAAYVIHTVGPQNKDPNVLRSAYESSLTLTATYSLRTIAFPSISTGIYGFPPHEAAPNACEVVRHFLERNKTRIDRIIFVVFDHADKRNYEIAMSEHFPVRLSHTRPSMGSGGSATARRITSITSPSSSGLLGPIPSAYSARSGRRLTSPTRIAPTRRMTSVRPITSALRTTSASSLGSRGSHGSIRRRMMPPGSTRPRILLTMRYYRGAWTY